MKQPVPGFDLKKLPRHLADDLVTAWEKVHSAPADEHDPLGRVTEVISSVGAELSSRAPRLLCLIGAPRSGKDHLAEHLQRRYRRVLVLGYSTPIIEEVNGHLADHGREITIGRKSLPHYRHLLQAWGLARRAEDPSYWIRPLAHKIDVNAANGARLIILSGARLPSDFEPVHDRKGVVWKVVRPGNTYRTDHEVEASIDMLPCDLVLMNDVEGDPSALEQRAEDALYGVKYPVDGI